MDVKVPFRVGALRAPRIDFPKSPAWLKSPKFPDWLRRHAMRKSAGIAGAVVLVAGAGVGSALFVDYLADRAVARAVASPHSQAAPVAAPAAPEVAKAAPAGPAEPKRVDTAPVAPAAAEPRPVETTRIAAAPAESRPAAVPAAQPSPPVAAKVAEADAAAETTRSDDSIADRTFTAAIAPRAIKPEPAPLPVVTAPQAVDGVGEQAAVAAAEMSEEAVPEAAPTRTAKVTDHVNLRAGPNDESKVLTVVPAKETVEVVNCKGWCEVEFKGRKGFIYKSFLGKS